MYHVDQIQQESPMAESFVYITCATERDAEQIGTLLVEQRLAACVNILPGMRSLYWWEGRVQKAEETVLVAKTKSVLVEKLTELVKSVHGYEVPCVVELPIKGGNQDFLRWIRSETISS